MSVSSLTRSDVPGPSGSLVLGNLRDLRRNPLQFFTSCAKAHGPIVQMRAAVWNGFLISDPGMVKQVLHDRAANYSKENVDYWLLKPVIGNGLLTSEGPHWLRQRRTVQPAFAPRRFTTLTSATSAQTTAMLDRWSRLGDGTSVELTRELARPIITIIGETLFGCDLSADADEIDAAFNVLNHRFGKWTPASFMPFLWTPGNLRCRRALRILDRVAARIIAERRRADAGRGDLLSMLLAAADGPEAHTLSTKYIRDEIVTFLLAGYETTVTALTWTCYLLASHPEVDEKVQRELRETVGDRRATADDLPRLGYTRMVLEESMRLYPPVWVLSRAAVHDDQLDGKRIPAGSLVFLSPYVTHRLPEWWPNPDAFIPERFAQQPADARPRYSYFPFGGGPRHCIGRHFAMLQSQLVLAMVLQRYRFTMADDRAVEPMPLVTLRARNGLHVRLHRR